jgi:hypothetical protein
MVKNFTRNNGNRLVLGERLKIGVSFNFQSMRTNSAFGQAIKKQ